MKKYTSITLSVLFLPTLLSFAAEYTPLVPGAFTGVGTQSSGNLGVFLGQAFNWAIAMAVVLALIMIIWGGIEYMTTDSWSGKDDGKTRIRNALWGLGLALISYLILYTINPNLVDFKGNKFLGTGTSPETGMNTSGKTGTNTYRGTNTNLGQ